ncbi:hypothetical protein DAT35_43990 [Vitiosangium sp. GDMCC 1.1324]|nr:hypothetical protein DAT35_43990 [Vitiosangium sp. GDMCC 1.1324]
MGLALAACGGSEKKPEELQPKDCNMETGVTQLADGFTGSLKYTVTYEVTGSGEGTITKIYYYDGPSTPKVVENPTLPWTKTVSLYSDQNVGIAMEGSVTNGHFEVKYSGEGKSLSGGSSTSVKVSKNNVCEQLQSTTVN